MKLVIAGGGTGGHLFPGIAVAEEFLSRDPGNRVLFVGTEKGIEGRVLPKLHYPVEFISAAGVRGKSAGSSLKGMAMLLYGYAQSRKILKEFQPDFVLGVGGYASAPVVFAARGMLIPRFIHEQNAIPGFANKVLSFIAEKVFISLEESRRFFPKERTLLTGNPLRGQILAQAASESAARGDRFNVLVFGGSAGAHRINTTIVETLPLLGDCRDTLSIVHQTGEKDLEDVRKGYEGKGFDATVSAFIDDMAAAYAKADLVICRAGATTIAEVTACGKPCIFIPFPYATDDHQRQNAEALLKKGAGFMFTEKELTPEGLATQVKELVKDRDLLSSVGRAARSLARLDAAKVIVDEITNPAEERKKVSP